jgi:hypothetical protein
MRLVFFHYWTYDWTVSMRSWTLAIIMNSLFSEGHELVICIHFSMSSTPALGSTQPPIQWVPGALSRG